MGSTTNHLLLLPIQHGKGLRAMRVERVIVIKAIGFKHWRQCYLFDLLISYYPVTLMLEFKLTSYQNLAPSLSTWLDVIGAWPTEPSWRRPRWTNPGFRSFCCSGRSRSSPSFSAVRPVSRTSRILLRPRRRFRRSRPRRSCRRWRSPEKGSNRFESRLKWCWERDNETNWNSFL